MKLRKEQYFHVLDCYLRHFPTQIPDDWLNDYKSIVACKHLILQAAPDSNVLQKIATVVTQQIKEKRRYQKMTMLRLLKRHRANCVITEGTIEKLFFIFRSLIVDAKEDIAWKLTTLLKDLPLSELHIEWLIYNYHRSPHIVNRLVRYPLANRKIYEWAKARITQKDLESRLSELIGIQLNFNKRFRHKNRIAFAWGIHYSKLDDREKKDLLLRNATRDSIIETLKICERNGYIDLIEFFYSECAPAKAKE